MASVATHQILQPGKPKQPYRVTLDMKATNENLHDKGPSLIPNIGQVVAKLTKAHTYLFAIDIKKHYWQVRHQSPKVQCFRHREA